MSTAMATANPPAEVGLDPTGIRRLTLQSRERASTKQAVTAAIAHEMDCLQKKRYRAVKAIEELDRAVKALEDLDREIGNLKTWQQRQQEGEQP